MNYPYLRKERREHTLQPTELAHEAYLKLIDISNVNRQDRAHLLQFRRRLSGTSQLTAPAPN